MLKSFNRFYRVDKARSRDKGGNGLGLSIAQRLVEGYHEKFRLKAQLGMVPFLELHYRLSKMNLVMMTMINHLIMI